jgi:OOP family OmpA-OmpF porin
MKNVTRIAIAVAMVGSSQLALADGPYLIAAVGSAVPATSVKSDIDNAFLAIGARGLSSSMSSGSSMAGGLGYSLGEGLAVEVGYFNSGTMTYSGTASGVGLNADIKITAMQIALIGSFPMNENFSLYGKAGYSQATSDLSLRVGSSSASTSDKKSSGGYGLGAIYKVSDKVSVRAGYEIYASDLSGFTVGAQLKF